MQILLSRKIDKESLKSIFPSKRPIENSLEGVVGNFAVLCEKPQSQNHYLKALTQPI